MRVGIIGVGIVGDATKKVLEEFHEIFPYDKYKESYNSEENLNRLAKNSEVVFICVSTPMKPNGEMDYSSVYNSLDSLQKKVEETRRDPQGILIIIRSTAVSGSTDKCAEKYPFRFTFNPEFLRERCAFEDMKNTDRIVIGANSLEDYEKVVEIYHPIFPNARYINVDRKTAEMIKYVANVMLTGQIAVANEIHQICKVNGIDYDKVKEAV